MKLTDTQAAVLRAAAARTDGKILPLSSHLRGGVAVETAWSQLETAHDIVRATRAAVKSAEMALNGVREEAKSGQRTTQEHPHRPADAAASSGRPRVGRARPSRRELCHLRGHRPAFRRELGAKCRYLRSDASP